MSETRENGKKATQPCPCGHSGDRANDCHCSGEQIQRYRHRVSGPLLDRIDLHVEVPRPEISILDRSGPAPESSAAVLKRVTSARRTQLKRQGCCNALLDHKALERNCAIDPEGQKLLERAATQLKLSPRAVHRILKVARTLADLDAEPEIAVAHLAEAISFRTAVSDKRSV